MDRLQELRARRAEVLSLAARHGVSDVRVFGSVARGEETEASDVDLLVKIDDGRSLFDLCRLYDDIEELLGLRVDIVTEGGVSRYLRDRIFSEAVPL